MSPLRIKPGFVGARAEHQRRLCRFSAPLLLRAQLRLEFLERDVGGLLYCPEDEIRFFLGAIRAAIAALLLRSNAPHRFLLLGPADRARHAHPEPCGRPSARHPLRNRVNHTLPKIYRKRTSHACWPPSPAHPFNHKFPPLETPPQSSSFGKCSSTTAVLRGLVIDRR